MSLSVSNGGIGSSPAISRIQRLTTEIESGNIAINMRRVVQIVETRAGNTSNKRLWNPFIPASLNPVYPVAESDIGSLTQRIFERVADINGRR